MMCMCHVSVPCMCLHDVTGKHQAPSRLFMFVCGWVCGHVGVKPLFPIFFPFFLPPL